MKNPNPSVVIVGCGSIGERHLRSFLQTGRVRVAAYDTSTALLRRMAEVYRVPTISNLEQALAESFDAAVIATPAHVHVPIALEFLQQGKHVMVEKPLSLSMDGIDELIRARDRGKRQAGVAYVYHMHPFLVEAREYLRRGELGAIRHVVSTSGQNFPRMRPAHAQPYAQTYYRDRATGGGAIQDALTHLVNWVESVIGPTDSVLCDCAHQVLADVSVEDTVNVSARHGDILVNYSLNQFQAPNESTLQFHAAKGSVKIEFHRQRWGVFRDGDQDWDWHETRVADRDAPFIAQAHCFLDQIAGGALKLCTLEAAAQTLSFSLAALASAESGTRVACASFTVQPGAQPVASTL